MMHPEAKTGSRDRLRLPISTFEISRLFIQTHIYLGALDMTLCKM